jgi:glycerol 2-dehydrogenase (NADP+)
VLSGQPSPGQPSLLLDDEEVVRIAKTHDAAPAQVLLSWGVQHGIVVIPKSENEGRMRANLVVRALLLSSASYANDGRRCWS